jgi:hypothetical protein
MPSVHKWAYDFGCNQSIESILDAFNAVPGARHRFNVVEASSRHTD